MSNVELWTYISYGIAALFFIAACVFAGLIYVSSQNSKKNPIALPSKKPVVEEQPKEFFDEADDAQGTLRGSLPNRRRKVSPVMHEPKGNLRSSKNFFEDDDDSFKITSGQSK